MKLIVLNIVLHMIPPIICLNVILIIRHQKYLNHKKHQNISSDRARNSTSKIKHSLTLQKNIQKYLINNSSIRVSTTQTLISIRNSTIKTHLSIRVLTIKFRSLIKVSSISKILFIIKIKEIKTNTFLTHKTFQWDL